MESPELLSKLVAFPTISRNSNLDLIDFAKSRLESHGFNCFVVPDETRAKANLFASLGPAGQPGVLLSGHSDVVPTDGQDWSSDPFELTERNGALYGRGAADMKGFVACALRMAERAAGRKLKTPLWIALSHDEEIGCVGVRRLIDRMEKDGLRPRMCIVGEPTSMAVATGHKGKLSLRARCTGRSEHSAFPPETVNALHLACDFVGALREEQAALASGGRTDGAYRIPCTTIHASRITGGTAPNIVPSRCDVDFEIRYISSDDPEAIVRALAARGRSIASGYRAIAAESGIEVQIVGGYPGLETPVEADEVRLAQSLAKSGSTTKVAFGTEAGMFASRLGCPAVVCGPGSMEQGHKADEYVERSQMEECDSMLDRLLDRLESGL